LPDPTLAFASLRALEGLAGEHSSAVGENGIAAGAEGG
jgi:hypothetical protein